MNRSRRDGSTITDFPGSRCTNRRKRPIYRRSSNTSSTSTPSKRCSCTPSRTARAGAPASGCYVPTHSLLTIGRHIISPEASLAALPGMDGYIAQVWTGTWREPMYSMGRKAARVRERLPGVRHDDLDDRPDRPKDILPHRSGRRPAATWDDYKRNYQATYTVQLMYPMVDTYEVMPWPCRIYRGRFKLEGSDAPTDIRGVRDANAGDGECLNDMPRQEPHRRQPRHRCAAGQFDDVPAFSHPPGVRRPAAVEFLRHGLILLKHGMPVETVHMENLGFADTLKASGLATSYANISRCRRIVTSTWPRGSGGAACRPTTGGTTTRSRRSGNWWNRRRQSLARRPPTHALGTEHHIQPAADKERYECGRGVVHLVRRDRRNRFWSRARMRASRRSSGGPTSRKRQGRDDAEKNHLRCSAVLTTHRRDGRSVDRETRRIEGPVIDLFDPELPVLSEKVVGEVSRRISTPSPPGMGPSNIRRCCVRLARV